MFPERVTRVLNAVGYVLLAAALLTTALVAVPQLAGASHSYVVVSGSMSPTIEAGDVVFVAATAPDAVETGDVLAFDRVRGDDRRTVHRVVEVVDRDGQRYFRTQGDANEEPDPKLVPASAVIGTVQFWIPYVGWVFSFVDTDAGLVALVIVPGVLLVVSELWNLVATARATDEEADPGR